MFGGLLKGTQEMYWSLDHIETSIRFKKIGDWEADDREKYILDRDCVGKGTESERTRVL